MGRLAAVLAALGLAAFLTGCGGSGVSEATTVTITRTETVTRTVTEPAAGGGTASCSAAGLSAALPAQEVPAPVAAMREEIAKAAVACDYDRLQELALQGATGFTYSYGGETSASDFWAGEEERGVKVMAILVGSLATPAHLYQGNWVWPSAYTDAPTDADWAALSGLYTADEIASYREQGQFLGYRVGITPAGDWQFFVAGD